WCGETDSDGSSRTATRDRREGRAADRRTCGADRWRNLDREKNGERADPRGRAVAPRRGRYPPAGRSGRSLNGTVRDGDHSTGRAPTRSKVVRKPCWLVLPLVNLGAPSWARVNRSRRGSKPGVGSCSIQHAWQCPFGCTSVISQVGEVGSGSI